MHTLKDYGNLERVFLPKARPRPRPRPRFINANANIDSELLYRNIFRITTSTPDIQNNIMASPMDALPTSDNFPGSSARSSALKRRSLQRGSSARPGGPPSESNAPQSDDEGFADDQIPASSNRPRNLDRPVPKVEDKVGLVVQEHFERFLET